MSYFMTTVSHATTGVKSVTPGFQPIGARITVSSAGTSQAVGHFSQGITDGTHQCFNSTFSDVNGSSSWQGITKMVSHYERVSGTLTEVLAISFDSFNATQFKYNVGTANVNYSITVEAWS